MTNATLAHNWAHKRSSCDKSSSGNMLYYGDVIYSYGNHFPIAKRIGNETVLFTYRKYSVTTEKHKQIVRSACSHLRLIHCKDPLANHKENIYYYITDGLQALKGIERARRNTEMFISDSLFYFENLKEYLQHFNFQVNKEYQKEFESWQSVLSSETAKETYIKEQKERARAERLEKEKKAKQALERWFNFETGVILHRLGRDYLRFNSKTNRIETSKGVEIPCEIARRFQNDLINGNVGAGYRILHYAVNKIDGKTVQIGCHTFPLSYLKQFQF